MELSIKKDLVFLSEFQQGIQRRLESQNKKKRNEKNLNPPEGYYITYRISEAEKKIKERNRRK